MLDHSDFFTEAIRTEHRLNALARHLTTSSCLPVVDEASPQMSSRFDRVFCRYQNVKHQVPKLTSVAADDPSDVIVGY